MSDLEDEADDELTVDSDSHCCSEDESVATPYTGKKARREE